MKQSLLRIIGSLGLIAATSKAGAWLSACEGALALDVAA